MICAWQAFIDLLPVWMRESVDKHGKETLQELRLRIGIPPELVCRTGIIQLKRNVTVYDLQFCINAASKYSPWTATSTVDGYITAPGGHRIGVCGKIVNVNGVLTAVKEPTSLCLRVARDFPGIAEKTCQYSGSILIIGCPGSGKTTLLRDMIRNRANNGFGSISVVDEREEIFPYSHGTSIFDPGKRTDILSGCRKAHGIISVLRSMGPMTIAVDEITAEEDCKALLHAGWCGVALLATAHASCKSDLMNRAIYRPIMDAALFDTLLIMNNDKTWTAERLTYDN